MKTKLKTKSVSLLLVTIMLCSIFTGAVTADVNSANESKNINIIDEIISIIKSIFADAESDDSGVDSHTNVTGVKVELIRSFSDEGEFGIYIGKPKREQVVILSKSPRKIMSEKEIKFYDSKGNLLSTYSCKRCEVSQSPNGRYIGVLTTKDFTQLNFTLFNQFGKVVWQNDNFHATTEGSVYIPSLTISPDGEWIVLVRASSEEYKTLYLFDNLGEGVGIKKSEGSDLGDLTQPTVDFIADSNKLSVKFPNKILLLELIKGEEGVAKE